MSLSAQVLQFPLLVASAIDKGIFRALRHHDQTAHRLFVTTVTFLHTMADYDSDSSGAEDVATSVLLGYASKEPTGDDFSQLGGHPVRQQESLKRWPSC
jgi:hypothetical protein